VTSDARPDGFLLDRIRLAATLVGGGVAAVFVGELILRPGERPALSVIQAVNLVVIVAVLGLLRSPANRRTNLLLAFVGCAVTIVCTGAAGIVTRDATTAAIVIIAIALGSATIVPWGTSWQLLTVVVSVGVAIWTVSAVVASPEGFWVQQVGSIVPTLAGTVFVARVLGHQRLLVERAEREREAREESLRETNQDLRREVEEHRRTEGRLRFALRELDHRVKNMLATVESVARHTLESSQSRSEFGAAFHGRIQSMARIHAALAVSKTDGLAMHDLIELAVGPYRGNEESLAITSDGGTVVPDLVRPLSMALHELATNAAKYGALSTPGGRVIVSSWTDEGANPYLHVIWQEANGPRVTEPIRRGLGTKLIEEGLAYDSSGTVSLRFLPSGVRCEIDIPLPRTASGTANT